MNTMWAELEFAKAYLDDVLQRSENHEQHRKHIKAVFKKMDEYGFKLGWEKCEFFMKQIKFLSEIIDENGRPGSERAEVIKNMTPPNNVTNLLPVLGLSNYNSIYISKCMILKPHLMTYWKRVQNKKIRRHFPENKKLSVIKFIVSTFWP